MPGGIELDSTALRNRGADIARAVQPFALQCGMIASVAPPVQQAVPGIADAILIFAGTWDHEFEILSQDVVAFGGALVQVADAYDGIDQAVADQIPDD
jgi:hypothetical protein